MKNAFMTAALLFATLVARAQTLDMLGPLASQVLHKTSETNGGVKAIVSVSGKPIELRLTDGCAPFAAHMAPAALPQDLALKPAAGLVPRKTAKVGGKKAPSAASQLKRVAKAKSWSGR